MDPANKIVVITGAGSGIGRSLAQRLHQAGAAHIVCVDLQQANAEATATAIGADASARALDVADEAAMEAMIVAILADHGRIDLFVSNAGYGIGGGLELPTSDWQRMMDVHLWSHLAAARAVIPAMLEQGSGYLLNTASAAGLLTQLDSAPYAVSKHAAVAFAEWVAITYGDRGIGVSVLCPQAVRTAILGDAPKADSKRQAAADGIMEPDDVADECIEAIREERFMVLPHKEVATYFQRKANDYDRWLGGMRRFRRKLAGG